jgi:hypothetical protein
VPVVTAEIGLRSALCISLRKFLGKHIQQDQPRKCLPDSLRLNTCQGISGIFGSQYDYSKLSAGVSHYKKVPPYGSIYYNIFAGRTFGTLPYMLLDIAPGNEIYYYNKYAFNLMNRYEYVQDKYIGINFEHNIGNGLFRFIPL